MKFSKHNIWKIIAIVIALGFIIAINLKESYLQKTTTKEQVQMVVIDKSTTIERKKKSRSTTYYNLELKKDNSKTYTIKVSNEIYNSVNVGDIVNATVQDNGSWNHVVVNNILK